MKSQHSSISLGFNICFFQSIRAPIVWNRPTAGLFDYHYDVAGLYYQVNSIAMFILKLILMVKHSANDQLLRGARGGRGAEGGGYA